MWKINKVCPRNQQELSDASEDVLPLGFTEVPSYMPPHPVKVLYEAQCEPTGNVDLDHEFSSYDDKCCHPVGNKLLPCGKPKEAHRK